MISHPALPIKQLSVEIALGDLAAEKEKKDFWPLVTEAVEAAPHIIAAEAAPAFAEAELVTHKSFEVLINASFQSA